MPENEVDILIVGAGLAGASTAYHLARSSDLRVLIVEKEHEVGVHSSGRSAAFVREQVDQPSLQPLVTQGAEFLRSGELARFEMCGLMLLGLGNEDVQTRFPPAQGKGLWCPRDGKVDVSALLQSYLAGQSVQFNTEVLGWQSDADKLRVSTNQGELTCVIVVNAAGPWAGVLGDISLTPLNRHLFQTPPLDSIDPHWPFVWDTVRGLYFLPESGGLLLSACDELPAPPGDYSESPAVMEELAEKLQTSQPGLGDLSIKRTWVGQRVFAPDRNFVIGFDPRDQRVFHVAGLGGHGVTTSYVVGKLAARLISGQSTSAAEPFDPARLF